MKKVFILMISILTAMVLCIVPTYGNELSSFETNKEVRYIPCPNGGRHQMHPVGLGHCYEGPESNPGESEFYGTLSQCSGCNVYMLSEHYLHGLIVSLGKYTVTNSLYLFEGAAVVYGGSMGSYYYGDPQDSFIAGFEFY